MTRDQPACVPYDGSLACSACGRFGAYRFEDESLCVDCYQQRGACCAEFGGNDLWTPRTGGTAADAPEETARPG